MKFYTVNYFSLPF